MVEGSLSDAHPRCGSSQSYMHTGLCPALIGRGNQVISNRLHVTVHHLDTSNGGQSFSSLKCVYAKLTDVKAAASNRLLLVRSYQMYCVKIEYVFFSPITIRWFICAHF